MAMQRLFSKLRSFSVRSAQTLPSSLSSPALLRSCPPLLHHPLPFASIRNKWTVRSLFIAHSPTQSLPPALTARRSSAIPFSMVQVRHVSSRERKKRRKPMTPVTSKLKKTKMKSYSSYKSRFRTMTDGTIRRWRAGKRHNAHLKIWSLSRLSQVDPIPEPSTNFSPSVEALVSFPSKPPKSQPLPNSPTQLGASYPSTPFYGSRRGRKSKHLQ